MIIRRFIVLLLITVPIICNAAGGLLDKVVTVSIKNTQVKFILEKIETIGKVQFSYNPTIVNENKVVSLNLQNQTIKHGLTLILDKSIRFKEVGNHIILLKHEEKQEIRERKRQKYQHTFRGKISDYGSGEFISGASIYDVEAKYAALSNQFGYFELVIPLEANVRSIYIKKQGYKEKVIVLDVTEKEITEVQIRLERQLDLIEKLEFKDIKEAPKKFEERATSGIFISQETYQHGKNLEEINDSRLFQISLVPSLGIGSNLSTNGLITNNFSLNLLSGYANGVDGAEIGGLVNVVKGDVRYFQAGGISNIVGGDIFGVQLGGISNLTGGNFVGIQAAGIANKNKLGIKGLQLGGIVNFNFGEVTGCQGAGIYNLALGNFLGAQVAGIANMAEGDFYGGQLAGIANTARKGRSFFQLAGITNTSKENLGLQLSGIFNYTKINRGFQFGLINAADSSSGLSMGLINFVKKGYHGLELSSNTFFQSVLKLKSGTQRLYNSYGFGYRFGSQRMFHTSIGIGTTLKFANSFQSSFDIEGGIVWEESFNWNKSSQLYTFSPTIEYVLGKRIAFFGGPTFNAHFLRNRKDDDSFYADHNLINISTHKYAEGKTKYWIGFQAGIRIF